MMIILAASLLAAQAAQPAPVPAPEEKQICRRVGAATGSVLNRPRECHTKAEWDQIARAKAASADRFNNTRNRNVGMMKSDL